MAASPNEKRPPGPRGLPLIGTTSFLTRPAHELVLEGFHEYGDTVAWNFGPMRMVLVNDPDAVHRVLVANHANYRKSRNYRGLKLVLGEGLVTSEGSFWRRQRKLAQPAFHHRRLQGFALAMVRCTEEMLEGWAALPDGAELDLHAEMMRLTFRIVGHTLFSVELGPDAGEVGEAIEEALFFANWYVERPWALPPWVPTSRNRRFVRARDTLNEVILRIIAERRQSAEEKEDLLAMLMSATDETGTERMTDAQLRDEVMTLVLAGHETTANALTWTFLLLSENPEHAVTMAKEAGSLLGDRAPGFMDLKALSWTEQVAKEGLRLYPPAWIMEREALEEDTLAGYRIAKNTIVAISPWTMHRHPKYWPDPERFDPERFTPEAEKSRPRHTWFPFGGGPRTCIGNGFAMMELKLLLAMINRRFRIEVLPGEPRQMHSGVTLRPVGGVRARIHRRAPARSGALEDAAA